MINAHSHKSAFDHKYIKYQLFISITSSNNYLCTAQGSQYEKANHLFLGIRTTVISIVENKMVWWTLFGLKAPMWLPVGVGSPDEGLLETTEQEMRKIYHD